MLSKCLAPSNFPINPILQQMFTEHLLWVSAVLGTGIWVLEPLNVILALMKLTLHLEESQLKMHHII